MSGKSRGLTCCGRARLKFFLEVNGGQLGHLERHLDDDEEVRTGFQHQQAREMIVDSAVLEENLPRSPTAVETERIHQLLDLVKHLRRVEVFRVVEVNCLPVRRAEFRDDQQGEQIGTPMRRRKFRLQVQFLGKRDFQRFGEKRPATATNGSAAAIATTIATAIATAVAATVSA